MCYIVRRFYNNYSSFVHGGLDAPNRETLPVVGQKQIHNRIQQLNFRDCHAKISQVTKHINTPNMNKDTNVRHFVAQCLFLKIESVASTFYLLVAIFIMIS